MDNIDKFVNDSFKIRLYPIKEVNNDEKENSPSICRLSP